MIMKMIRKNYLLHRRRDMDEKDRKMVEEVKRISAKGHNAEVKQSKDGKWIVYEVKKDKKMVG